MEALELSVNKRHEPFIWLKLPWGKEKKKEKKGKLHASYTFLDAFEYKSPPVRLSTNTLLNLYVITITEGQGIALEDHVNVCVSGFTLTY